MKKYFKIYVIALLGVILCGAGLSSCKKYDNPPAYDKVTDADILADQYEIIKINEFKQVYFYDTHPSPAAGKLAVNLTDKIALKGKVIGTDAEGNIYKSLYIQDYSGPDGGGIEIKIGKSSMYNNYKVGQIIYVKTDGLVLGNYRWMLSLGGPSADADYSNGYMVIPSLIEAKILRGEIEGLKAADTLVINSENVATALKDPDHLGCLVRFEELTSKYGTVTGHPSYSSQDNFPSYLFSGHSPTGTQIYNSFMYDDPHYSPLGRNPDPDTNKYGWKPLPKTWAYKYNVTAPYEFETQSGSVKFDGPFPKTEQYFGSSLFLYNSDYPYLVRASGYSQFATKEIPDDNDVVDITAIYTKYCSSGGDYQKFQLLLNTPSDVVIVRPAQ